MRKTKVKIKVAIIQDYDVEVDDKFQALATDDPEEWYKLKGEGLADECLRAAEKALPDEVKENLLETFGILYGDHTLAEN